MACPRSKVDIVSHAFARGNEATDEERVGHTVSGICGLDGRRPDLDPSIGCRRQSIYQHRVLMNDPIRARVLAGLASF